MIEVWRNSSGVLILGDRYGVGLYPTEGWETSGDPVVRITVQARSRLGAEAIWVRLNDGEDSNDSFALEDVQIDFNGAAGARLRCSRLVSSTAPDFRSGFELTLEPGMGECCVTELPKVALISTAYVDLVPSVVAKLGREPFPHEKHALRGILAQTILEGLTAEEAIGGVMGFGHELLFPPDGPPNASYVELAAVLQSEVLAALIVGQSMRGDPSSGQAVSAMRCSASNDGTS